MSDERISISNFYGGRDKPDAWSRARLVSAVKDSRGYLQIWSKMIETTEKNGWKDFLKGTKTGPGNNIFELF